MGPLAWVYISQFLLEGVGSRSHFQGRWCWPRGQVPADVPALTFGQNAPRLPRRVLSHFGNEACLFLSRIHISFSARASFFLGSVRESWQVESENPDGRVLRKKPHQPCSLGSMQASRPAPIFGCSCFLQSTCWGRSFGSGVLNLGWEVTDQHVLPQP